MKMWDKGVATEDQCGVEVTGEEQGKHKGKAAPAL